MNDDLASELVVLINQLNNKLDVQNARQDEANDLMRAMTSALQATAQELLELRQHLQAGKS